MQSMETALDRRSQMFRATVLDPLVRPGGLKTGFGREQEVGRIGIRRLGDETLGTDGPVRVGGVNEIDSQLDCMSEDSDSLGMVARFPPDPSAGKLHRAKAKPANRDVAAD